MLLLKPRFAEVSDLWLLKPRKLTRVSQRPGCVLMSPIHFIGWTNLTKNRGFLRGYRDTCPTVAKRHRSAVDFISGSCSCNSTTSPITVASLFQTPSLSHESDTKTVRLCTNNETNWVFTSFKRHGRQYQRLLVICLSLSSFLMRQHIKIMKQSCLKTQKILYCMIPSCGISCYQHL